MKESKILKIISYIILAILTAILVLSIFTILTKENNDYYNEEQYFSSEYFVNKYMLYLQKETNNLIHNNESYRSIQDGDIKIHYSDIDETYYFDDIKNRYFLIIYKDKALTNVELTSKW